MPKSDMPDFTWSRTLTREIIDALSEMDTETLSQSVRDAIENLTTAFDEAQGETDGDLVVIKIEGGSL